MMSVSGLSLAAIIILSVPEAVGQTDYELEGLAASVKKLALEEGLPINVIGDQNRILNKLRSAIQVINTVTSTIAFVKYAHDEVCLFSAPIRINKTATHFL